MNRPLRKRHARWWLILTVILIPLVIYAYLNYPLY